MHAVQIKMNTGLKYGHDHFMKNRSITVVKQRSLDAIFRSSPSIPGLGEG